MVTLKRRAQRRDWYAGNLCEKWLWIVEAKDWGHETGKEENQDKMNYEGHCCGWGNPSPLGVAQRIVFEGPRAGAVSNRLKKTPEDIRSPALLGCASITPGGIRPSGLLWCWRSSGQKAKRCVACSWNDKPNMRWVWTQVWSFAVATAEMRSGLKDVTLPPEGFATHYKWDFPPNQFKYSKEG